MHCGSIIIIMLQLAHECGKVLSGHWLWRWNIIKPPHDWAPKEIKHLFRDGCAHTVADSSSHSACFNLHCSVCWTKCTIPGHKSMQKLPKKEAYELWPGMLTRRGDKTGSTLPLRCRLYHIQGLLSVNTPHLPWQRWGNCAVSVSGYNTYESGIYTIPLNGDHYWMVSSCSDRWLEEMGNSEETQGIVSNCINHLDSDRYPPITDLDSGLVYMQERALCTLQ